MKMIVEDDFDINELIDSIRSPKAGCMLTFIGTVRDVNEGADVVAVEIDSYNEMAEKELGNIITEAKEKFNIVNALVRHRSGRLEVEENIVFIGVSAPHREDGFAACRYIIEQLKKRVPLFKKEYTTEGEVWLKGDKKNDDG
jgi:molybdopterin synthase catalytic subunit